MGFSDIPYIRQFPVGGKDTFTNIYGFLHYSFKYNGSMGLRK